MERYPLFIVSAPSGAGKTTLVNRLVDYFGNSHGLKRLVTYATRSPRSGEVPGKDYMFIALPEFEKREKEGFFLESSGELGTWYGTGKDILDQLAQGPGILILDQDGARKLKDKLEATLIWITVPSIEILAQRLRARGTENEAQIVRRLARAAQEMALERDEKLYHHCIENIDLERAVEELGALLKRVFAQRDTKRIKKLLTGDIAHV